MSDPNGSNRNRSLRWLKWIAIATLLYALIGFLVVPWIIQSFVLPRISKEINRPVQLGSLKLNPFTLSATLTDFRIGDLDGETLLSWDRVHANLQSSSFFSRTWTLTELSVTNPYVRFQLNKDLSLNVSDLIQKISAATAKSGSNASPSKSLSLNIHQVSIEGARISATDLTPRKRFRRILGPVALNIVNFHTDPERNNPHTFTGVTDSGEQISWSGGFSLAPFRAAGSLSISNITLNQFAPLYEDLVQFQIRNGVAAMRAEYQITQIGNSEVIDLSITNVHFGLRSLEVAAPDAKDPLLSVTSASIANAAGSWSTRRFSVDRIAVDQPQLTLSRNPDSTIPALQLLSPADPATARTPGGILVLLQSVTNLLNLLQNTTNLINASLQEIALTDGTVSYTDQATTTPAKLRLDQIQLQARHVSNIPNPAQPMTLKSSIRWNNQGSISTEASTVLKPLSAQIGIQLKDIDFGPLNPYLDPYLNIFVRRSRLGLDGMVRVETPADGIPSISFKGSTQLADFTTAENPNTEELISWNVLSMEGMEAVLNPPSLSVGTVSLEGAHARLALLTNGALNVMSILKSTPTNTPVTSTPGPSATTTSPNTLLKQVFAEIKSMLGTNNFQFQSTLPKLKLTTLNVTNLQLDLQDQSISPNANLSLKSIAGTLRNLSTEEALNAELDFSGTFTPIGPFHVSGHLNPLQQFKNTELKLSVQGADLLPGDPYAGKFLGYRLTRGKASIDVHYTINERAVKGANKITLNQFTLGEKVPSTNAIKLPIKMGLALLADRDGKIELDVPIEGNLDDPDFRIGRVVWRIIGNIFTKAVTAPFALLGRLFGGSKGEEMQFQDFEPGNATITPSAREKLDAMVKAMNEKSGLNVETEGHVSTTLDAAALQKSKLEALLLTKLGLNPTNAAAAASITPDQRTSTIRTLFAEKFPPASPTANPDAATPNQPPSPQVDPPTPAAMESKLLESLPVQPADLASLAKNRAIQIQTYLVETGKITSDRVFLSSLHANSTTNSTTLAFGTNGPRVYLQIR